MPFAIRDFKPDDFDTLWRMDQECFPPGIAYSRSELKIYVRHKKTFTLVAEGSTASEAKPVGKEIVEAKVVQAKTAEKTIAEKTIAGFIVAHQAPIGHIITIDVLAPFRRSGVGSLLLQAAEDRLLAAGSQAVSLETAVDNLSALAFYKRHGYSVLKTWPRYYSNGVDALGMKKEFSSEKDRKK